MNDLSVLRSSAGSFTSAVYPDIKAESSRLNPHNRCFVIRLPSQKFGEPNTIRHRKEVWKTRRWMERFSQEITDRAETEVQIELTRREKVQFCGDVCRDTCWVICCPPCSTTGITNKLAFSAPRHTSYWPVSTPSTTGSPDEPCLVATQDFLTGVKVFWITTSCKNRICCTHVKRRKDGAKDPVVLYNHSNADDLGTLIHHLRNLSKVLQCDVFAYDYTGYGLSEGEASLSNFYADAEAAYLGLRFYFGYNPGEIILYGSSLGSVAVAHLAVKYSCRGVVMMASVSSGIRLMCRAGVLPFGPRESYPFDRLDNMSLASKIRCPALVMHGEDDHLCSIQGAQELVRKLPFPAEPGFYKEVGHDEVTLVRLGCMKIARFIHSECAEIWRTIYASAARDENV